MSSLRNYLTELIEQGLVPAANISQALAATGISPSKSAWRNFVDKLLLWLGCLAIAFSAMFFIAFNWNDIGRFAKFGLVESLIVLSVLAYWKFGASNLNAKLSLLMATIFLGVLLALYGQTYQTGADTWELFFNWALLMLPWAFLARFPAMWILWLALLNLSIVLYHQTFGGGLWRFFGPKTDILWTLFLFNTAILLIWGFLERKWKWLAERWATGLIAIGSGIPITLLVLEDIFSFHRDTSLYATLCWLVWLPTLYFVHRKIKRDLFVIAGCCLSGIVVIISFLLETLVEGDSAEAGLLFLAFLTIGLGSGAAVWLRSINKEWQE